MIWLVLLIMTLSAFLMIAAPLYEKRTDYSAQTESYADYEKEIAQIEKRISKGDDEADILRARKINLQRQMLKSAHSENTMTEPHRRWVLGVAGMVIIGTAGLYAWLGSPNLTGLNLPQEISSTQSGASQNIDEQDIRRIVEQLGQRLSQNGGTAEEWTLYARSLLGLKEYDAALAAYEKAVLASNNNPNIAAEHIRAMEFISAQKNRDALSGPSQEDIDAAQSMSDNEQQVMIETMVESLAARLEDNPENVEGWVRLLRSRGVLGQVNEARADIARIEDIFKNRPEVKADILSRSGWITQE